MIHLNTQGFPNSNRAQGRVHLFLMCKQNLNPSVDASKALKIIENGLKMRKLLPHKVLGVKDSK
jgi:hypothetical protein